MKLSKILTGLLGHLFDFHLFTEVTSASTMIDTFMIGEHSYACNLLKVYVVYRHCFSYCDLFRHRFLAVSRYSDLVKGLRC